MIGFRIINDNTPNNQDATDRPWHELAIEIWKIPSLDTATQILLRRMVLNDIVFDCLIEFCRVKCIMMLQIVPNMPDRDFKNRDELKAPNSEFKQCMKDMKVSKCALRETLLIDTDLKFIKPDSESYCASG